MIDLSIHDVKAITTNGVNEWREGDNVRYTTEITFEFEDYGINVDAQKNWQSGNNQCSFTVNLYADTLEALEFQIKGVNKVIA
tara:strand:- start:70 stop:318 length:249 start_codon:yes stop_codon:yes gene_type:complete